MSRGHRITVTPANVHVEVRIGGQKVAESDRPVQLEETGLPTRYYLPRDDVRTELLTPTSTTSHCPFKGDASYWSVGVGDAVYDDVVWSYESPLPEVHEIAGLLCFYNEKVDLTVDSELESSTASADG